MRITPRVALEVAAHEGIVRQAYRDSVGTWTWSVGLTDASGHKVERYIDNPQPMQRCLEVWLWVLERYAEDVREAFPTGLSEAEFAAALSFHWNTGSIGEASWVDAFNEGDIEDARRRFMLWDKPAEIIDRRKAERDLFFEGVWSGDGTILEYTRLTSRHTPVWSSAERRDVTDEIAAILGEAANPQTPEQPSELETVRAERDRLREILAQIRGMAEDAL